MNHYIANSEIANRCLDFEKKVTPSSSEVLEIGKFCHPMWSQANFIDTYGTDACDAKILKATNIPTGNVFYLFAAPQGEGYVGFIIGSCKEVYVSAKNHALEEVKEMFKADIEGYHVKIKCLPTTSFDESDRVHGMVPEVIITEIELENRSKNRFYRPIRGQISYWKCLKDNVEKMNSYY